MCAFFDAATEDRVALPEGEDALFEFGKVHAGVDGLEHGSASRFAGVAQVQPRGRAQRTY